MPHPLALSRTHWCSNEDLNWTIGAPMNVTLLDRDTLTSRATLAKFHAGPSDPVIQRGAMNFGLLARARRSSDAADRGLRFERRLNLSLRLTRRG